MGAIRVNSSAGLEQRYTLLIPTYNRPQDLARLLRFLARLGARFPVLVLDSSREEIREANRTAIGHSELALRYLEFDPATPPFEKFWHGTQAADTEFASFCADDDLVLVGSLEPLVRFLSEHTECAVAHGWYFSFRLAQTFELMGIAYCGDSINEAEPIARLHHLMRGYEALTYGVYRTNLLHRILSQVQAVKTNMARELLGSVLAVIAGKAARLPMLYHGRAMGPSMYVADWHPVDYLISSPERLFEEYASYRNIVAEFFVELGHSSPDRESLLRIIDQIHWRYATDYFKPAVIDYVFDGVRRGASRETIMSGMWPLLLAQESGASPRGEAMLRIGGRLRRVAASLTDRIRSRHADTVHESARVRGRRTYRLHHAFQVPIEAHSALRGGIPALLETLDAYE